MNAKIYVKGYVFCKNRGQQQFIKKQYTPISRSINKSLEDSINNTNSALKDLDTRFKKIEDTIVSIQKELEECGLNQKNIIEKLDMQRKALNKVIEHVNSNKSSYWNKYADRFINTQWMMA